MKRWLPGILAVAGTLVALRAASGCSTETNVAPALDATDETSVDAARPRDAGRDVDAAPKPGERQGWNRWDDYDPKCNFEVPSEAKYLPEPFEWEPCQDTDVTRKLACRRIKKNWQGNGREFISPATTMFRHDDGRLFIITLQYLERDIVDVIAPVDGTPVIALRSPYGGNCTISGTSAGGSRYVFQVSNLDENRKLINPSGAIGGSLSELRPRLLMRKPPNGSLVLNEVAAGSLGFINNSAGLLEIYSWDTPPNLVRTQQGNGRYSFVTVRNDYFFYAADRASSTERIWTPEGGDQHFIGDGADFSRGTADLNTDGVDWVWGEGESRTTGAFPTVRVVTAPFTRDPSKLQRRVLRNDMGSAGFASGRFAVGHGYAGHGSGDSTAFVGSMIVRLSDGAAWLLPGRNGAPVIFQDVLAFTADEAFTLVRDEHGTNVYRVRLDSLGAFALPPAPN